MDCLNEKNLTLKIMTYNVEWGFINLPKNINTDSCGHKIPLTAKAQYNHLDLCVKNISGLKFNHQRKVQNQNYKDRK